MVATNLVGTVGRVRHAIRLTRDGGPVVLGRRVARLAYDRLGAGTPELPLHPDDVAESAVVSQRPPAVRRPRGERLVIGWVSTPPGLGSGGHTTMFRMVQALEQAGHQCVLYLYDRYGGDVSHHARVIRAGWPAVKPEIRPVDGRLQADALIATSWQTAHVVATHGASTANRLYFVQDFEPFFYGRGSEYALAEDTYRFGFRCVAVGHMVARLLREQCGVTCDVAEFGCDTDVYRPAPGNRRSGLVFYAKPGNPRRGYLLGHLALEKFHREHPEVEIHVVGDSRSRFPFPVTHHGNLSPVQLAQLYSRCVTGLALSFTNISLAAEEMLACGLVPVVNDSEYARLDLRNAYVAWAAPTPAGLARALRDVIIRDDRDVRAEAVAASVRRGWGPAQDTLVAAVEDEVWCSRPAAPPGVARMLDQ